MALNAYDVAKHHIGLGVAGSEKGFTIVGAYNKASQAELGGATEYGGSDDLIAQVPGRSRWTQDDFTGGQYQYRLDKDAAMFAECVGFIPAEQAKSLITVPPIVVGKKKNVSTETNVSGTAKDLRTPLSMFSVAGSVFTVFPHGIARYRHDTDTFTWLTPGIDAYSSYVAGAYDPNEHMYYALQDYAVSLSGSTPSEPRLRRFHEDGSAPTHQDFWDLGVGSVVTGDYTAKAFQINAKDIVVSIGLKLYTVAPPNDTVSDGPLPTIALIGRLPGYWVASTTYNGMTYILCATLDGRTAVVAFDGTSILPIVDFPFNFNGRCIEVYGGRTYVGGTGYALDGTERYGELYEITGASVRKVRTFEPETRASDSPGHYPRVIRDMVVAEGYLWLSIDGDRLICYDIISDGFFGGSKFLSADLKPQLMTVCRGHLYFWNRDAVSAANDGLYRVAADTDVIAGYDSTLTTSDFVAEPAVLKTWSQITVQSRYVAASCEYSQDAGTTWTALSGATPVVDGTLYTVDFDLSALPKSKHIRFRMTLNRPYQATHATRYAELLAYTVAFVFSSTGKCGWQIAVNGAEAIEGRDGSTVSQDVSLMASTIWGWLDSKLSFIDIDGATRKVTLTRVTEQQPIIGPNITTRPEAYYALTLVEV